MRAERGFALVELLISIALFVAIAIVLLGVVTVVSRSSVKTAATQGSAIAVEAQIDALRNDAATSFAVFAPANDVFGKSNASAHELDYYSKSDTGTPVFWCYYYDAAAQTLRRYDYDTAGHYGEADRSTGTINAGQPYPALEGVSAFTARTLEASDLVGAKSTYASAIAPLFAGDPTPQPLPVGYDDGVAQRTDLYGGNTTIEVKIVSTHGARTLHLASAALPSGFAIHEYPEIRAVIYRHDTTHRSWFGTVQKSFVFVNAQLLISWTHFTEPRPTVWCDYNIYGAPNGLVAPLGPDSKYQPTWFVETTAGVVYNVTHGSTNGAHCSQTPPSPGAGVDPSSFFSPPPDDLDTPPPCFGSGSCWPSNAPPNWDPSPAPSSTPPAWWCGTHSESPLCGGTGTLPTAAPPPAGGKPPVPLPLPSDCDIRCGSGGGGKHPIPL